MDLTDYGFAHFDATPSESLIGAPSCIPGDIVTLCAEFVWGDDSAKWTDSMFDACKDGRLVEARWLEAKIEAQWQAGVRKVAMAGKSAFVEWMSDDEFSWNIADQMRVDQSASTGVGHSEEDRYPEPDLSMITDGDDGHMAAAKLYCDNGATDWEDVMQYACDNNQLEIAQWAEERGATDMESALRTACWHGFFEIARWAVARGASDLNRALKFASQYDQLPVAKWLKEQGATKFAEALEHTHTCYGVDTDTNTTRWLENLCAE